MKSVYRNLSAREIYPGLKVIYHPNIGQDNVGNIICRETIVLSEIKTNSVRVKDVKGVVNIESLELYSEYEKRINDYALALQDIVEKQIEES